MMTNTLLQEQWPLTVPDMTPGGEGPSVALQPSYALCHPSPTKQPTPVFLRSADTALTGRHDMPLAAPHLLVIDDSLTVRTVVELTHRRQGFALQTFADGVEALQWLHEHPTVIPGLVYLDIGLPHLDGYDVARILHSRPHLATVPIVMLSGRDGMLDRLKGRLAGANGYMTKPFRGEEILAQTRHYLTICPRARLHMENETNTLLVLARHPDTDSFPNAET